MARVDDYLVTQQEKFDFILQQTIESPPLIVAGDFLDKARPSLELLYWIMSCIIEKGIPEILIVPGQHDLPWHSLKYWEHSGLGILNKAGLIKLLIDPNSPYIINDIAIWPCPYGCSPIDAITIRNLSKRINILVWHKMVIVKGEELWPGQTSFVAGKILRQYREYDYIVTGDNHRTFIESSNNRLLINPGSMKRDEVDQFEHRPCVFKLEDGNIYKIFLPIKEGVLNNSHIIEQKEREYRIESFLSKLNGLQLTKTDKVSFKENLKQFFTINRIEKEVEEIVWKCEGNEHNVR
jgi:DNA repair exonuclease SbcCD nuclease subunit